MIDHSVAAPPAKRRRFRFSLLNLLLLTATAAMAMALWREVSKPVHMPIDEASLRDQLRPVPVKDPSKFTVQRQWSFSFNRSYHRWRAYVPEGGVALVHLDAGPGRDWVIGKDLPLKTGTLRLPPGEWTFELFIVPHEDGPDARGDRWRYMLRRFDDLSKQWVDLSSGRPPWIAPNGGITTESYAVFNWQHVGRGESASLLRMDGRTRKVADGEPPLEPVQVEVLIEMK